MSLGYQSCLPFYDLAIRLWDCSDGVVFFLNFILRFIVFTQFQWLVLSINVHKTHYLRNNSRLPGSMLILTWVGIIFVIILHRAKARCQILTNIMPTYVEISIEPGIRELFYSNRAFTVILCLQAYLNRGYFGCCSNYLLLLFTRIYNATLFLIWLFPEKILKTTIYRLWLL